MFSHVKFGKQHTAILGKFPDQWDVIIVLINPNSLDNKGSWRIFIVQ